MPLPGVCAIVAPAASAMPTITAAVIFTSLDFIARFLTRVASPERSGPARNRLLSAISQD